jgi:CHAD domain-containing protein
MPVSFLIRHWKKELQVFHKNLLLLKNSLNPEAIHDLRVSIKKLLSYTKLYSALSETNRPIPLFAETKKLFSVLGRQRNIEISLDLLKQLRATEPPLENHFEFYLNETKQRSASALQQYKTDGLRSLTIEMEKTISAIDDEITEPRLEKLIRSSVSEAKRQLKDFNKKYHLVRKNLKDIFYWSHILPADLYFSKQELKMLKSILDDLGNSQDYEVLRTNLQHYRKTVTAQGSEEYDNIKKLEEGISRDKQQLLDKADKEINAFLKRK